MNLLTHVVYANIRLVNQVIADMQYHKFQYLTKILCKLEMHKILANFIRK